MKKQILIACLLLVVLISGLVVWKVFSKPQRQVVHGILVKMDLPSLVKSADLVVTGRVKDKRLSAKDNSTFRISPVYTDFTLEVEQVLKNKNKQKPVQSELIVRLAGGKTSDLWVEVEDEAQLEPEEKVLLFLRKDPEHSNVWSVVGMAQGKFKIKGNKALNQLDNQEYELEFLKEQIKSMSASQ